MHRMPVQDVVASPYDGEELWECMPAVAQDPSEDAYSQGKLAEFLVQEEEPEEMLGRIEALISTLVQGLAAGTVPNFEVVSSLRSVQGCHGSCPGRFGGRGCSEYQWHA